MKKNKILEKKIFSIAADIFGYRNGFQEYRRSRTLITNVDETEKEYYLFAKKKFKQTSLKELFKKNFISNKNNFEKMFNNPFSDLIANISCRAKIENTCILSKWTFSVFKFLEFWIVPNEVLDLNISSIKIKKQINLSINNKKIIQQIKEEKKSFYEKIKEKAYSGDIQTEEREFFLSIKFSDLFDTIVFIMDKRTYLKPSFLFLIPDYFLSFSQKEAFQVIKNILNKILYFIKTMKLLPDYIYDDTNKIF
ncbi:hypothetical protein [Mesomycoplasma neurolyticum]|uniref:Uncharacterized protein n=1 Tax=Mesomycoplasma neurolyticum TaxID=2120 RepID=A0A449A593_9BACT|nr:hypothetical protein [Mesomycoplasma neurolyticum]VEU59460.1 Uncharacterised protein [Mesomycoplasma neurolyticum]